MTRAERMGFVDAWIRSGQTSLEFAESVGIDREAFREWILDYGRPSILIPVQVTNGISKPRGRGCDVDPETCQTRPESVLLDAGHRLIPVVIQDRP